MSQQKLLYAFILGKNPALAVAEIATLLSQKEVYFVVISISREHLVIKVDRDIFHDKASINQLGGVIKIAQVIDESNEEGLLNNISSLNEIYNFKGKITLGISWYNCSNIPNTKKQRMGFDLKKILQKNNSVRLVIAQKESKLNSAEILHNKIIEKGIELCIISDKENRFFISQTLTIQDFEKFSLRDYDKPGRDAKSGMLPPKLALSMINLIPSKYEQICDPFCGTGTVLGEALILGKKFYGSDISEKAILLAKQNIEFLKNKFSIDKNHRYEISVGDATRTPLEPRDKLATWVVSEMYLGQAMSSPKEEIVKKEIALQKDLLIRFLNNINKAPHINGLIMAIPFYFTNKRASFLPVIDEIIKMGYTIKSPFGDRLQYLESLGIFPEYHKTRKTILYRRSDQVVGREIIIISK